MSCSSGLPGAAGPTTPPRLSSKRLVAYRDQTSPLLDYYGKSGLLKSIDGLGTVQEIFDRVQAILDPMAG